MLKCTKEGISRKCGVRTRDLNSLENYSHFLKDGTEKKAENGMIAIDLLKLNTYIFL
jgi:hypothetical protein